MSEKEHRNFASRLAYYAAPTLLGIKCGGLLSLSSEEFDVPANLNFFNDKAVSKGLKIKQLCSCKERQLILVYNEKLLQKRLADNETAAFLRNFGYNDFTLDKCLERLSGRIAQGGDFPHEIGVFLDYPTDDIIGFISNKGRNFKFCGCWKVYGDAEKAKRNFENYEKCRRFLCNKLNEGISIYRALKIP